MIICTSSKNGELYKISKNFRPKGIEQFLNIATHPRDYASGFIVEALKKFKHEDILCFVDEDAFITNDSVFLDLIDFVRNNNEIDFVGTPDGFVRASKKDYRWSHVIPNLFFVIIKVDSINKNIDLSKLKKAKLIDNKFDYLIDEKLLKKHNIEHRKNERQKTEPYYQFFNLLFENNLKPYYLDFSNLELSDTKRKATVLYFNEKPFIVHSWFARHWTARDTNKNKQFIKKVISYCEIQRNKGACCEKNV